MQEEERGISLADIFRTIFVQKWLTLAVAVIIAVVGTLGVYFWSNGQKRYYDMRFSLVLPGNDGAAVYTYPDGTAVHYSDFISYSSLSRAAELSGVSVDVAGLINNGDITIARNVTENEGVNYAVTAKADYFASYDSARSFLAAVANLPVKAISEMTLNYDVYLTRSLEADDYESQINLLISQLENVENEFKSLLENYGGLVVADGKTLNAHYNEIKIYSERGALNNLLSRVRSDGNAILKSDESKKKYEIKRTELERQLEIAEYTLNNLLQSAGTTAEGVTVVIDATVVKQQSDLVGKLKSEIKDIDNFLADTARVDPSFEKTYIEPEYNVIKDFTDGLNKVVVEVYDKSASVSFIKANVISVEGGTSLLTAALTGLIAGVVVALIAGYIAGRITLSRRGVKAAAKTDEANEAVLQAAATNASEEDGENKE